MDEDYIFFEKNMERLYEKYGHKFLAIKGQNVIGVYDTFQEALDVTLKTEKLGTFLIQECFKNREENMQFFQGNVSYVGEERNI